MNIKPINSNIVQTAMRHAKIIRLCSDFKRFKLGAVIFNNKKILTAGANTNKTCPSQFKYNHFRHFDNTDYREVNACCHAEMAALVRLRRLYPRINPSSLSIFVYRENAQGEYAMAKPCRGCEQALKDFGIRKIYYTGRNKLCCEYYLD